MLGECAERAFIPEEHFFISKRYLCLVGFVLFSFFFFMFYDLLTRVLIMKGGHI